MACTKKPLVVSLKFKLSFTQIRNKIFLQDWFSDDKGTQKTPLWKIKYLMAG